MEHRDGEHSHHKGPWIALGFAAGAATAFAVAKHLVYGPGAAHNRHRARMWLLRAKAEILERMGDAQDLTEEQYRKIVDEVMGRYGAMREVGRAKAQAAADNFKRSWEEMRVRIEEAREETERELEEEVL